MNKGIISSLSILAFAFALVMGFGTFSYSNADDSTDRVILFGDDQAHNFAGAPAADRDTAPRPVIESHGLQGTQSSTY